MRGTRGQAVAALREGELGEPRGQWGRWIIPSMIWREGGGGWVHLQGQQGRGRAWVRDDSAPDAFSRNIAHLRANFGIGAATELLERVCTGARSVWGQRRGGSFVTMSSCACLSEVPILLSPLSRALGPRSTFSGFRGSRAQ